MKTYIAMLLITLFSVVAFASGPAPLGEPLPHGSASTFHAGRWIPGHQVVTAYQVIPAHWEYDYVHPIHYAVRGAHYTYYKRWWVAEKWIPIAWTWVSGGWSG